MFISVTIQTYNNAEMLSATLESLCTLRCPEGAGYEVLVVDNNSSDHTQQVIKTYAKLLEPRLRSVFERRQGLSYARNRALCEARGEIVCFLDDDVKVENGWLEAVYIAFKENPVSVVGGRSYLIFQKPRPCWLSPTAESLLSRLDLGDKRLVDTKEDMVGLNLAVLRKTALDIGGFNNRLGRNGNLLISGEEHEFLTRVREAGGIIAYEPKAVVGHIVPKERLTKSWFLKRSYFGGISGIRMKIAQGQKPQLKQNLLHCLCCFGGFMRTLLFSHTTAMDLFERQIWALFSLGALMETVKVKAVRK